MEELTRVLVPLIEDSVKRHIESLALRISHKLEAGRGQGSHKLKLEPNQTDNDSCCLHTNTEPTLSQHHLSSRVRAGAEELQQEFQQTLNTWGLETGKEESNDNHLENILSMGFKKTTLQDYFIGEYYLLYCYIFALLPSFETDSRLTFVDKLI